MLTWTRETPNLSIKKKNVCRGGSPGLGERKNQKKKKKTTSMIIEKKEEATCGKRGVRWGPWAKKKEGPTFEHKGGGQDK